MTYLIRLENNNFGTYLFDDGDVSIDDLKDYQYIADDKHSTRRPSKGKKYCYLYILADGTQVASICTSEQFENVKVKQEVDMVEQIFNIDSLIRLPYFVEVENYVQCYLLENC